MRLGLFVGWPLVWSGDGGSWLLGWLDFQPDPGRCVHGGCDDWEDEPENTPSHLESLVQYKQGQVQEGTPAWWFPVGEFRNPCKIIFQNHSQRQNLNKGRIQKIKMEI